MRNPTSPALVSSDAMVTNITSPTIECSLGNWLLVSVNMYMYVGASMRTVQDHAGPETTGRAVSHDRSQGARVNVKLRMYVGGASVYKILL